MTTLDRVMRMWPSRETCIEWLNDRKNRRAIPHRFESCGYAPVRNDTAKDGLWVIGGKRQVVYGRLDVSVGERIAGRPQADLESVKSVKSVVPLLVFIVYSTARRPAPHQRLCDRDVCGLGNNRAITDFTDFTDWRAVVCDVGRSRR